MTGPQHDCEGDDCGVCERRIADIEYEQAAGYDDVDDYYDGT